MRDPSNGRTDEVANVLAISSADLLTAVIREIRENGFSDRSLRDIASAVGSSHRMLIYHFGSREGLLEAVVTAELTEARTADEELFHHEQGEGLRARWERSKSPSEQSFDKLFFELAAHAARRRPETERFRAEYVEPWLNMSAQAAEAAGADPTTARALTRLDVAVLIGLGLDRLLTGDETELDAAFDAYDEMRDALAGEVFRSAPRPD